MPRRVCVVGGGVVGLSTALTLAQEGGCEVTVLEAGPTVGGDYQASSVNAGIVHDPAVSVNALDVALMRATRGAFDALETAGHLFERHTCGELWVATTPEEARFAAGLAAGLPGAVLLDGAGVHAQEPALGPGVVCGVYFPRSQSVHPRKVVEAFGAACVAAGVTILTDRLVDAVCWADPAPVMTRRRKAKPPSLIVACGRRQYLADDVVLATGFATVGLAASMGLRLPVVPVFGTMWSTAAVLPAVTSIVCGLQSSLHFSRTNGARAPGVPPNVTHSSPSAPRATNHLYFKQSPDGAMMAGGDRVADPSRGARPTVVAPEASADAVAACRAFVGTVVPCAAATPVARTWAGVMPFTADGLPLVGPTTAPSHPPVVPIPLWVATGSASSGMSKGAGSGVLLARMMLGDPHAAEVLAPCTPSRCAVQSKL